MITEGGRKRISLISGFRTKAFRHISYMDLGLLHFLGGSSGGGAAAAGASAPSISTSAMSLGYCGVDGSTKDTRRCGSDEGSISKEDFEDICRLDERVYHLLRANWIW